MTGSRREGLIVDGLWFGIRGQAILNGVYMRVNPGTVCGLIGRNGCGKSTAMRVAAGHLRADSGIIQIDGERFHGRQRRPKHHRMAYLPQDNMLPMGSRVATVARMAGLHNSELADSRADQRVAELSGGERRLLAVEVLLNLQRDYYLLDEPFSGVEPRLIEQIILRMREAAGRGAGILVTDHYTQYVTAICDDGYLMQAGQCTQLATPLRESLVSLGYLPSRTARGVETSSPEGDLGPTT